MINLRRTSDEKRPGRGRQRINPRESQGARHDRTENTGNRSQLPVTPWFASRTAKTAVEISEESRIFPHLFDLCNHAGGVALYAVNPDVS